MRIVDKTKKYTVKFGMAIREEVIADGNVRRKIVVTAKVLVGQY